MTPTSLKMAICLTLLFFAKISFSYDQDLCLQLAEEEGIEFNSVFQCYEVVEEIESKKGLISSVKDPYLCSFVRSGKMSFEDIEEEYEQLEFYDIANNFYSTNYQTLRGNGSFAALFIDEVKVGAFGKARSASIEMSRQRSQSAEITYTLYKNKFASSSILYKANLECEIIRK